MAYPTWSFVMRVGDAITTAGEELELYFEIDGFASGIVGPDDKLDVMPDDNPFGIGSMQDYIRNGGVMSIKKKFDQVNTPALFRLFRDKTLCTCILAVVPFKRHNGLALFKYWKSAAEYMEITDAYISHMTQLVVRTAAGKTTRYEFVTFEFRPVSTRMVTLEKSVR